MSASESSETRPPDPELLADLRHTWADLHGKRAERYVPSPRKTVANAVEARARAHAEMGRTPPPETRGTSQRRARGLGRSPGRF